LFAADAANHPPYNRDAADAEAKDAGYDKDEYGPECSLLHETEFGEIISSINPVELDAELLYVFGCAKKPPG